MPASEEVGMNDRSGRIKAILDYLSGASLRNGTCVSGMEYAPCGYGIPEAFPEEEIGWIPFGCDDTWGGRDQHFLFRAEVPSIKGQPLAITLSTDATDIWNTDNPQILMYLRGKLHSTFDMNHRMAIIPDADGGTYCLGFYAYSNTADAANFFRLSFSEPAFPVISLYHDMRNIFEAAELLDEDDEERIIAFRALDRAVDLLDTRNYELLDASVPASREALRSYMSSRTPSVPTVWAVGSTHIDLAWKWPLRQTEEKAVRSTLTALNLMERYPSFRFMLSQPWLYEAVRRLRPDIFGRIMERIKEGRWEAEGGMWVESDCVLSGGESLVRQFIHGRRYITGILGAPSPVVLWLPDAFGFNGNMPQIMAKSGMKYFMTTKMNWSDTHRFPYDAFTWRGIDGTEVLAYFISTKNYDREGSRHGSYNTTYNGLQNASQIMGTWQRFQDKAVSTDVLTCFGYGDGGGGPIAEMLDNTERLSHSVARCPKTAYTGVREFFERFDESLDRSRLRSWTGELYFEYHRGTLTSIAEVKKHNRIAENLVHDAEALAIISGIPYPEKELDGIWKTILLNQFHDILPGSATDEVYEEAFEAYGKAEEAARGIISDSLSSLSGSHEPGFAVASASGHRRTSVFIIGSEVPGYAAQKTYDGRYAYLAENVPAYGAAPVSRTAGAGDVIEGKAAAFSTPFYSVRFSDDGHLVSLFDKENEREVIREGKEGNAIISYEDRPLEYDNWNLEKHYREKPYPWSIGKKPVIVENGPLRGVVEVVYRSLSSVLTEHIVFYRHTHRIDFIASLDWDGDHQLVKAEFPVDVHASCASYEIQFGAVERPAVANTSWDRAKFEVPALRWCDISEPGYGVSLITDSRYGCSIRDGVMTLSLLKSGTFPAISGDRGHHEFMYSLYPHSGTWREGGTVLEAEDAARPLHPFNAAVQPFSFASSDTDGVVIETIKRTEDGNGIAVRVYEAYGMREKAVISFSRKWRIAESDLMEENRSEGIEGSCIERVFHPYEIVTFILEKV